MKKAIISAIVAIISPILMFSQGIKFEEGTFQEALDKAKQENKMLYLDVYTTWCGPCKMMAKELFPKKESGDKYNANFINYKIDAEKGEGLQVAEKYAVVAYPTNLFINPKDGEVVYRVTGASDLKGFVGNADIAIAEYKDPMKWEDYVAKLKKGNTEKAFLQQYLAKAKRLEKVNDEGLDIYAAKYVNANKISDADLKFLMDNIYTLDNKVFPLLEKNTARVNTLYKNVTDNYFKEYVQVLYRGTISKFAESKDEQGFERVVTPIVNKYSVTPVMEMLFLKDEYFKDAGDHEKYNDFLYYKAGTITAMTDAAIQKEDAAMKQQAIKSIAAQLKANKVPKEQYQKNIDMVLKQNPSINKIASIRYAQDLNRVAWSVYEDNKTSKTKDALKWSKRSLELTNTDPGSTAAFMDTYARLLYVDGQKDAAIAKQKEAIKILKDAGIEEDVESFEEALKQMQNGEL